MSHLGRTQVQRPSQHKKVSHGSARSMIIIIIIVVVVVVVVVVSSIDNLTYIKNLSLASTLSSASMQSRTMTRALFAKT